MLRNLASNLYAVKTQEEAQIWIQRLFNWRVTFKEFLSEMTRDSNDNLRATHERLLKAYNSLVVLINTETMFRYLDETLELDKECPITQFKSYGCFYYIIRGIYSIKNNFKSTK